WLSGLRDAGAGNELAFGCHGIQMANLRQKYFGVQIYWYQSGSGVKAAWLISGLRLVASGFWLLASGFWLLASGFRLPASGFRLPASGFRLPASGITTGKPK